MLTIEPVRLILIAGVGFLAAFAGTGVLAWYLARRRILDLPNERSSHSVPTPRGGGIAVVGALGLTWLIAAIWAPSSMPPDFPILAAAVLLACMCFIDDLRGLPALPRLGLQIAAVAFGIWHVKDEGGLFAGLLPTALDLLVTGFLWLWFVNLFNFMDGIDGITGVEMVSIGIALAGLAAIGAVTQSILPHAVAVTAVGLGFLVWNWRPARIFMGDVGSVPVGYLIGWILITAAGSAAENGVSPLIVLIPPAYYVADATITLLRRLARGENILEAHRQHYYQCAVIRGHGHDTVCMTIAMANLALAATAWFLAPQQIWMAAGASIVIVIGLLFWMTGGAPFVAPTAGSK